MPETVVGVVDCPSLKMFADFLGRRGYRIVNFLNDAPPDECAVLLFCSDHLASENMQRFGRESKAHKLLLNAEVPESWEMALRMSLPLLPLELEQQIASLTEEKETTVSGFRILVVEDDVTAAMTLVRTFQDGGFSVKVCRGYAELANALQQEYDLIVMDLNLPGISGEKLGEMIRKHNIPMVIFSSESRDRLDDARKRTGAVAAFPKDAPQRTMREWIRNYLQMKAKA